MSPNNSRRRRFFRFVRRAILLIVVLLVIVLAINTARFRSRQRAVPPATPIVLPEDEIVDRFAESLKIKTISHQARARMDEAEFAKFQAFLETKFPLVHQHLTRMTGTDFGDEDNYSLLYEWQGSDDSLDAILLMAHYDVVPILTEWQHGPFSGFVDETTVWGRGAIDNKASLMGLLEAIELLLSENFQPERTIYLSFGHDEEIGGKFGNSQIAEWMKLEKIRLKYVLDEGGGIFDDFPGLDQSAALVGIGEKGYATIEISVDLGEAGHSSIPPPVEETVVGILSRVADELGRHPHPADRAATLDLTLDYLGPEMVLLHRVAAANRWLLGSTIDRLMSDIPTGNAMLRTTMAPTLMDVGEKENVMPSSGTLTYNLRILPDGSRDGAVDRAKEHIENVIANQIGDDRITVSVSPGAREPSRISSTESDSFNQIHDTIREVYPDVLVSPFVVVAGTDASHFDDPKLTDNIYRFVPWQLGTEDLKQIHGADERMSKEHFLNIVRFYERLIRNTANKAKERSSSN